MLQTLGKTSPKKRILHLVIAAALMMAVFMPIQAVFAAPYSTAAYSFAPPTGKNVDSSLTLTGNAAIDSKYLNTVILTPDVTNTAGSVWSSKKIDLKKPMKWEMYLYQYKAVGKKGDISDGITFTLQNDPDGVYARGMGGAGLGVYSTTSSYVGPALSIEFDTYNNGDTWGASTDPKKACYTSHTAFVRSKAGRVNPSDHISPEYYNHSCTWRRVTVDWSPKANGNDVSGTLSFYFDATCKTSSYTVNSANAMFGGTNAYWGVTGATGNASSINAVAFKAFPETPSSTIVVAHKDKDTGAVLKSDTYLLNSGSYGPYPALTFNGYENGYLAPGSAPSSGTIAANQTLYITYLYAKKPTTGTVNVVHKDADTGFQLQSNSYTLYPGYYGPYSPIYIQGYGTGYWDTGSAPPNGNISAGQTLTVVFLYKKLPVKATINVFHYDETNDAIMRIDTHSVNPGFYGPYKDDFFEGYNPGRWDTRSDPASGYIAAGQIKNIAYLYIESIDS